MPASKRQELASSSKLQKWTAYVLRPSAFDQEAGRDDLLCPENKTVPWTACLSCKYCDTHCSFYGCKAVSHAITIYCVWQDLSATFVSPGSCHCTYKPIPALVNNLHLIVIQADVERNWVISSHTCSVLVLVSRPCHQCHCIKAKPCMPILECVSAYRRCLFCYCCQTDRHI